MHVDLEQGLVAFNNVQNFLCLRDMFVYIAPDGHCVNSQSSFELQRRNIGFKLGHKIVNWE